MDDIKEAGPVAKELSSVAREANPIGERNPVAMHLLNIATRNYHFREDIAKGAMKLTRCCFYSRFYSEVVEKPKPENLPEARCLLDEYPDQGLKFGDRLHTAEEAQRLCPYFNPKDQRKCSCKGTPSIDTTKLTEFLNKNAA